MTYICIFACLIGFIVVISVISVETDLPETARYGKRFNRKLCEIESAISHSKLDAFELTHKGRHFSIKINNTEPVPGFHYSTIPVYTCTDVFIDDELVCKVHKLKNTFKKYFSVEFSSKREYPEVEDLIYTAAKLARKMESEYWKNHFANRTNEKSFYSK